MDVAWTRPLNNQNSISGPGTWYARGVYYSASTERSGETEQVTAQPRRRGCSTLVLGLGWQRQAAGEPTAIKCPILVSGHRAQWQFGSDVAMHQWVAPWVCRRVAGVLAGAVPRNLSRRSDAMGSM